MAALSPGYARMAVAERRALPGARRVGPANPTEKISLSILLRIRPDTSPLPDHRHWMATPASRRKHVPRSAAATLYGAAQDDADRVTAFAQAQGFTITEVSLPRRTVFVSCTVEQASRTFAVDLDEYERTVTQSPPGQSPRQGTQRYRSYTGIVALPTELIDIVVGVFGLDNHPIVRRAYNGPPPGATTALSPRDVAALYNFPLDPPTSNAQGQTVAVLEFNGGFLFWSVTSGFQQSDIDDYVANLVGPRFVAPQVVGVSIDNEPIQMAGPGVLDDPSIEVALDIEVIAAVAQGAGVVAYFAPNSEGGWIDALTYMLADTVNDPSVLSISWAGPEDGGFWAGFTQPASQLFQQAAALGMTVMAASGDWGSSCDVTDGFAHVEYPPSDPWVTGCGGTTMTDVEQPLGKTFTEIVWNDDKGATGGGISTVFSPPPPWQLEVNLPLTPNPDKIQGRGVPDIAGNASPYTGYPLWVYGQETGPIGGTSAVAPLYAALVAIINSQLGYRVGFLNPALYALGVSGEFDVFNDITQGWNNEYLNWPNLYYPVSPGWDGCTGWGSVDGKALMYALASGTTINGTATSASAPAVCVYYDTLIVFWRANDGTNAIWSSVSFNGLTWPAGQSINGAASTLQAVTPCFYQNSVYLFWAAVANNGITYIEGPGAPWAAGQPIDATDATSAAPAAVVADDMLQLFWKANDPSNTIYSTAQGYIGALGWPGGTQVGSQYIQYRRTMLQAYATLYSPASIVIAGNTCLFWTANDGSGSIFTAQLETEFTGPDPSIAIADANAESGPALCQFNNLFYMFWTSAGTIYFSSSPDGVNWAAAAKINRYAATTQAPATCVFNNLLYVFWTDDRGTGLIHFSLSQDGINWS